MRTRRFGGTNITPRKIWKRFIVYLKIFPRCDISSPAIVKFTVSEMYYKFATTTGNLIFSFVYC